LLHQFIDFLKSLTDPQRLGAMLTVQFTGWLGYAVLSLIVFAETGLLAGFFLPGDSLLFAVGMVCGFGYLKLQWIVFILTCAAILGDNTGYFLGRAAGPLVFSRPKSRFFHPDHVRRARDFYEKYGGRAIIYARFVPVIRTCMPFMAGVAGMRYPRFVSYSLFGGFGWILLMTCLGFKLGSFPVIQKNIEIVILGIVVLSLIPVALQFWRRPSVPAA
jgi:membrane-associated protein